MSLLDIANMLFVFSTWLLFLYIKISFLIANFLSWITIEFPVLKYVWRHNQFFVAVDLGNQGTTFSFSWLKYLW